MSLCDAFSVVDAVEPEFAFLERADQTHFVLAYINMREKSRNSFDEVWEGMQDAVGGVVWKDPYDLYLEYSAMDYGELFKLHSDLEDMIEKATDKFPIEEVRLSVIRIVMANQKAELGKKTIGHDFDPFDYLG